jgi:pentatricopeptide repeat protein
MMHISIDSSMFALRIATFIRRSSLFVRRSSVVIRNNTTQIVHSPHTTRLDLDQLLERLDAEAHRRGRLNPGLVRGAMHKATIELDRINPTQALLLIRCTGSLLISELPRQRQQVLDHMMKVFREKQVQFDVTHYNSYMRASLQNQSYFDSTKIIEEMTAMSIAPNLTSFRLMLECYARQGRSDDIQAILNRMRLANFHMEPLTLTHLLGSYANNGNVERVESLFELFKELDLKPISETYEQFIVGYLKQGRFDQAKNYFVSHASQMDNDSLFRLIISCAQCQQKDLLQSVLNALDQNSLADVCVSTTNIVRVLRIIEL